MPRPSLRLLASALLTSLLLSAASAASPFDGRWRLDPARSTALDGWNAWDLAIAVDGPRVSLGHDMQWRSTKHSATNVVDTSAPSRASGFFRVEQRHMALYPAKGGVTELRAAWLDAGRTLRVEADTPLEVSQGLANLRIYSEYRLLEGDDSLLLIELHHSRPQPFVYRFNRVADAE